MCVEQDRGQRTRNRSWDGGPHETMFVLVDIFGTHGVQFFHEEPAEFELATATRIRRTVGVGSGADFDVAQEAFEQACGADWKAAHGLGLES